MRHFCKRKISTMVFVIVLAVFCFAEMDAQSINQARSLIIQPPSMAPGIGQSSESARAAELSNCTKPEQVTNQFNITGLKGWDLVSHEDYLSNSASEHSHNVNCNWTIQKPDGESILLIRINRLELEGHDTCDFDSLSIQYEEYNSSANINTSYCGTIVNRFALSKSNVSVSFKTDGSVNYRGFHLQWAYVNDTLATIIQSLSPSRQTSTYTCTTVEDLPSVTIAGITASGGRLVSHETFDIESSSVYSNGMHCQWNLTSPSRYILLWIEQLLLERDYRGSQVICRYDNLTLTFSNAVTGEFENQTLCVNTNEMIFMANSTIQVEFKSDSSIGSRGFHIKWMYLNDTQVNDTVHSWNIIANSSDAICTKLEMRSNLTLDDVGTYPGGQLVSHKEYQTALDSSYHPNMNCSWTISPPNNSTLIHLKILTLELETGSVRTSVCRFDNLTFIFRNAITNRWEQKVACSSLHSVKFASNDDITIRFITDRSVSKRGFHLVWYFIPRIDMSSLPEWENLQPLNCPDVNENEGILVVSNYGPNSHCVWHWTLLDGERMQFNIRDLRLDIRDYYRSRYIRRRDTMCLEGRDRLVFQFLDSDGDSTRQSYCGRLSYTQSFVAYSGSVELTFISDGSVQGRGFQLSYKRITADPPRSDCSGIQKVNSHEDKISDRLPGGIVRKCRWTIQPMDANHVIGITVKRFSSQSHRGRWSSARISRYFPHSATSRRYDYCPHKLTMQANRTIFQGFLIQLENRVSVNNNRSDDIYSNVRKSSTVLCATASEYTVSRMMPRHISLGEVNIQLESTAGSSSLYYYIQINHIPAALPGSGNLCPKPTTLGTKHSLVEKRQNSRLLSVKQMMVTSPGDCLASVSFNAPSAYESMRTSRFTILNLPQGGGMLKLSVNCSISRGNLTVVADGNVNAVPCNRIFLLNWTAQQTPIILEAEGTGGFTVIMEQIKLIYEGIIHCPRYNPTNEGNWITNLPVFVGYPDHYTSLDMFYCIFSLSPTTGKDLIVQLQVPVNSDLLEQFCSQLSTEQYQQPHLSFITSYPNKEDIKLSLCNHHMPGGLQMQDKIRVISGGKLTVDLIAAPLQRRFQNENTSDILGSSQESGMSALIVVNEVDTCSSIINDQQSWKVNSDRTEIRNTVTILPNNSQTDCKLQLDAATAVRIANDNNIEMKNNDNEGACWNLRWKLDKLATTCGLNQLTLTASYFDVVAGTIVHRQKEVCGTSTFSFTMSIQQQQDSDIGMTLSYSGVRSGFVAELSISSCDSPMLIVSQMTGTFISNGGGNRSSTLIVLIVLLSIGILCVVLFAAREPIITRVRALIHGAGRHQRLSYTTGGDGVALIDDS